MPFLFQPWKIVLAALSEFVRKEQEKVIEYLQLENQILREKLGGNRVLLSDEQRRRLAIKGRWSYVRCLRVVVDMPRFSRDVSPVESGRGHLTDASVTRTRAKNSGMS